MTTLLKKLTNFFKALGQKLKQILTKFPFATFVILLVVLIASIVAMVKLQQPAPVESEVKVTKTVKVAAVGEQPELVVQAQVDKSGVIQVVAQTSGVVQPFKITEGQTVKNNETLLRLSTNYQGANSASVARQLAYKSWQFQQDTYDQQKQVIDISRRMAEAAETQASELRRITRQSVEDTKSLISLNEDVVKGFDNQIKLLESSNVGGINDVAILELKAAKAQVLGGLTSVKAAQRANEYTSNDSEEPAELARLSRDATIKQLEIQEKSLNLGRDIAALNLKLAKITESLFFPVAPCGGVIQRIHVHPNQVVNPGQVLVTIVSEFNKTTLVAQVPGEVAREVVPFSSVKVQAGEVTTTGEIRHISQEPTEGSLHTILITVPDSVAAVISNDAFVQVTVPVGNQVWKTSDHMYVPLDAVYQSQDEAQIYVARQAENTWQAAPQVVELGAVVGNYVQVKSGLQTGDQVILDRTVAGGDQVQFKTQGGTEHAN
jgi:multidrug efflux pump subunit AcrA (membrane-fusion protein)